MENVIKSSDFDSRAEMLVSLFRSNLVQDTDSIETNSLSLSTIKEALDSVKTTF